MKMTDERVSEIELVYSLIQIIQAEQQRGKDCRQCT